MTDKQADVVVTLADRLVDSGLGYYDDNTANKRYIAKLDASAKVTPIGTPTIQLRRINFPSDEDSRLGALEGVHVLREDGSFYSIPIGTKSLGDVFDPVGNTPLLGDGKAAAAKRVAAEKEAEETVKAEAEAQVEAAQTDRAAAAAAVPVVATKGAKAAVTDKAKAGGKK